MKDLISHLLFLAISTSLIFSPIVHADDAVPIEQGEPAPFSGTLLTDAAAASLLSKIRTCGERAESELQFEIERNKALCDMNQSLLQIQLDSQKQRYESIIQSQDEQLDYLLKSNTRSWLSGEAVFIIGVVSGVLITTAAAYGLSSAANID